MDSYIKKNTYIYKYPDGSVGSVRHTRSMVRRSVKIFNIKMFINVYNVTFMNI